MGRLCVYSSEKETFLLKTKPFVCKCSLLEVCFYTGNFEPEAGASFVLIWDFQLVAVFGN